MPAARCAATIGPMPAASLLFGLWQRALALLFPPRCVACGAFGSFLCPACRELAPRAAPPRCPVCWMPSDRRDAPCWSCRRESPAFEAARCPFVYRGAAREAVHALKYRGVSAVAPAMALPMAECLRDWAPPVDLIVPVPLAGRRQRLRGFNQSHLLAREVGDLAGLPVGAGVLVRRRAAPSQARSADEAARRANVAGAFAAERSRLKGEGVLLVDDVMTSGATLDACARALRSAGSGSVYALTFARED